MKIFKLDGAGNDFVGIDDRQGTFPPGHQGRKLVRGLCHRQHGIGADGVLLLQLAPGGTGLRMRYFNSDGGEAGMCGNGLRCFAVLAHRLGATGGMEVVTGAGDYRCRIIPGGAEIHFPDMPGVPRPLALDVDTRRYDAGYIVSGVPHLVCWLAAHRLPEWDVAGEGRILRRHPELGEEGANVNFASVEDRRRRLVSVRTYERGVEAETLACGTGAVATALCFCEREGLAGTQVVTLTPTSGVPLQVTATVAPGTPAREVRLAGPARIVFTTEIDWQDLLAQVRQMRKPSGNTSATSSDDANRIPTVGGDQ